MTWKLYFVIECSLLSSSPTAAGSVKRTASRQRFKRQQAASMNMDRSHRISLPGNANTSWQLSVEHSVDLNSDGLIHSIEVILRSRCFLKSAQIQMVLNLKPGTSGTLVECMFCETELLYRMIRQRLGIGTKRLRRTEWTEQTYRNLDVRSLQTGTLRPYPP